VVVLHEGEVKTGLGEGLGVVGLAEEAAVVAELAGMNQLDVRDVKGGDFHIRGSG